MRIECPVLADRRRILTEALRTETTLKQAVPAVDWYSKAVSNRNREIEIETLISGRISLPRTETD